MGQFNQGLLAHCHLIFGMAFVQQYTSPKPLFECERYVCWFDYGLYDAASQLIKMRMQSLLDGSCKGKIVHLSASNIFHRWIAFGTTNTLFADLKPCYIIRLRNEGSSE